MKKLLALVLVAVMAFSCLVLASCGDKKEETSTASENSTAASADESKAEESATSTEESAASADESAVSEEATSSEATSEDATSEDTTSEDATSEDAPVEIPKSIKETASYKYFASFDMTKGFTFKTELMGMSVAMSVLGENVYSEMSAEMDGVSESAKVIVKDGKAYMLDDATKTYTVSDATGEELLLSVDEFNVDAIFSDLVEYVSTTTEEIEGVTFTVDNFKTSEGTDGKIYMDAEGKVVMMGDSGMIIPFELTNTIPEGRFDIPADYTEVSAAQ